MILMELKSCPQLLVSISNTSTVSIIADVAAEWHCHQGPVWWSIKCFKPLSFHDPPRPDTSSSVCSGSLASAMNNGSVMIKGDMLSVICSRSLASSNSITKSFGLISHDTTLICLRWVILAIVCTIVASWITKGALPGIRVIDKEIDWSIGCCDAIPLICPSIPIIVLYTTWRSYLKWSWSDFNLFMNLNSGTRAWSGFTGRERSTTSNICTFWLMSCCTDEDVACSQCCWADAKCKTFICLWSKSHVHLLHQDKVLIF